MRTAFADIPVATDQGGFTGHHDIRCSFDAVDQRFPAAVQVVEFGLGDGVVDVDRGERQLTVFLHLIQALDAGRGFLRNAPDGIVKLGIPARVAVEALFDRSKQGPLFVAGRIVQQRRVLLGFGAQNDQQRRVAAIVQYAIWQTAVLPIHDLVRVFPVFVQGLTLEGEYRDSGSGYRCSRVVLRGIDIAGGPAQFGTQCDQRFDQHSGLDSHV